MHPMIAKDKLDRMLLVLGCHQDPNPQTVGPWFICVPVPIDQAQGQKAELIVWTDLRFFGMAATEIRPWFDSVPVKAELELEDGERVTQDLRAALMAPVPPPQQQQRKGPSLFVPAPGGMPPPPGPLRRV